MLYIFLMLLFLGYSSTVLPSEGVAPYNKCLLLIPSCAKLNESNDKEQNPIESLSDVQSFSAADYHPIEKTLFWTTTKSTANSSVACKLYSLTWEKPIDCKVSRNDGYVDGYIDEAESRDNISIVSLDEIESAPGNVRMLRDDENWEPRSLAVDYINDKLYLVDTSDKSVKVTNLDGRNTSRIFAKKDLTPVEVLIDPAEGLMFVLVYDSSKNTFVQIYRASMDGTGITLLFGGIRASVNSTALLNIGRFGFALDTAKRRVYFSNLLNNTVESMSYDGLDREPVVLTNDTDSIAVFNDRLYGIGRNEDTRRTSACESSKGGGLISCEMNELGHCDRHEAIFQLNVYDATTLMPHKLKMIDRSVEVRVTSPCGSNNGGCQQHCLLRKREDGFLGYRCVCYDGWNLTDDGKGCERT